MDYNNSCRALSSPNDMLNFDHTQNNQTEFLIQLFKPLKSAEVLEECRKRSTKRPIYALGNNKTSSEQEVLDLDPLFKDWRSAWSLWPLDNSVSQLFVFDIRLPDAGQIIWGHSTLPGFCVVEERVSRFVQGLATVMRVRSHGKARFELVGGKEYRELCLNGRRSEGFRDLERVLDDLSKRD